MTEERWAPPDLAGQVAVVTGASRGVGRGIAEVLGECGAKPYVVARSVRSLEDVADAIGARGGEAVAVACDVGDDEAIDRLFARIEQDDGHLELLMNNAVAWQGTEPGDDVGTARWTCKRDELDV